MLGVVIVTHQSERYIEACLSSVQQELKCDQQDAVCIVVDNASQDQTLNLIQASFPTVQVLSNESNTGFSSAVNQGVKACLEQGCTSVLLLNPDTRVEEGALPSMLETLFADPQRGVVQPVITLLSDPEVINTRGNAHRGFGLVWLQGYGDPVNTVQEDQLIDYASGACMLVRAEVFQQQLFDEQYFLYFEDSAFSHTVRQKGWQIWLSARARVQHDYQFRLGWRKLRSFAKGWWRFRRQLKALPSPSADA